MISASFLHAVMLVAAPSNAAARPPAGRGDPFINTRNRTDIVIEPLQTEHPTLALTTPASRKPNKTDKPSADPPAAEPSNDLPSPFRPFMREPSSAPDRAQQLLWAVLLLLGACGV